MDTPQEVEVWFVLPALRKEYVVALKLLGLKQKDIAGILDITEPAVSQYMKGKRGDGIKFSEDVKKSIMVSCQNLIDKKTSFGLEVQHILKSIKKNRFICGVCKEKISVSSDCEICYR